MTEIYLVRHCEAEGNVYRRIHGQYDSLPTPNGLRQLEALERRFSQIHVDACYASDLARASVTARAVCCPNHLPLHRDRRFREIFLGRWEDLPFGYLEHFETRAMHTFNHDPAHWVLEGAESFAEYTDRFLQAMEEAARANDGKTIAIVAHGCVLRGALLRLFFDPEHPALGHSDNTSVSRIFYENGQYNYDYIYDNSHLNPEISTRNRQKWWRSGNGAFNLWYRPVTDAGEFVTACHQIERMEGLNFQDAELLRQFKDLREHGEVVSAILEDKPIGVVATCPSKTRPDTATLWLLYLQEAYRGKRFGTQLLGQAVSYTRRQGRTRLRLWVFADNAAAIGFYEHSGFAPTGAEKRGRLEMERNLDPNQFVWK